MTDVGPGQYQTEANFGMSQNTRTRQGQLYNGVQKSTGFAKEDRWKSHDRHVNFRIGKSAPEPAVGSYNPNTSSFTKTKQGFNYRFY